MLKGAIIGGVYFGATVGPEAIIPGAIAVGFVYSSVSMLKQVSIEGLNMESLFNSFFSDKKQNICPVTHE